MSLSVLWPNRLFTFFHFSEVNHLTMCYPPSYSHRHQLLPHTALDSLAHVSTSSWKPDVPAVRTVLLCGFLHLGVEGLHLLSITVTSTPVSHLLWSPDQYLPAFYFLLSLLFIPSYSPHFTSTVQCLYSSQVLPTKVYCIEQTLLGGWRSWHRRSN